MIFCEKRKRREDAPFFRFFEARSGATQRGKSKKRGILSSFAARKKIMNSF